MAADRRYVVLGAGAIGAAIGGRLFEHGHDVVLIARGPHAAAMRADGLRLANRDGETTLRVPVVTSPAEVEWRPGDTVFLAVKSQDTEVALRDVSLCAAPRTPIFVAQNGVANEDSVLRWFDNVYAVCVYMPTVFVEPGRVFVRSAPLSGILDLGRYPSGSSDPLAAAVCADLERSTYSARPNDRIMRFKYAKLAGNLSNAIEAAIGSADGSTIARAARAEAAACFAAAGIDYASVEEERERRGGLLTFDEVPGVPNAGGSTWQSLARGTGNSEADYLNGEIVQLGHRFGVPVPVNAALQRVANRLARDRAAPGSMTVEALMSEVGLWAG